jgi:hypothetical protein
MTQTKDSTTGEREALKRCPFCEGKPTAKCRPGEKGETPQVWSVTCFGERNAHAWFYAPTEAEVIAAWNSRPDTGREDQTGLSETKRIVWERMLEVDDRNSPEEYPEMILMTQEELFRAMDEAAASTPPVAVPVSEERVEAAFVEFNRFSFREHGVRVGSKEAMRAALTAALAVPDKGVQGGQGDSRDPGNDQCGSRDQSTLGGTAALAGKEGS